MRKIYTFAAMALGMVLTATAALPASHGKSMQATVSSVPAQVQTLSKAPKALAAPSSLPTQGSAKASVKAYEDVTWNSLGQCKFTDDLALGLYGVSGTVFNCEIQESASTPGFYRLVNPYAEVTDYFNVGYDTTTDHYMYVHAENPDQVWFEAFETGVTCNSADGAIGASSEPGYYVLAGWTIEQYVKQKGTGQFGTLADGLITFPTKSCVVWVANDDGLYYGNTQGKLSILLPGNKDYAFGIETVDVCSSDNVFKFTVTAGNDVASIKLFLMPGELALESDTFEEVAELDEKDLNGVINKPGTFQFKLKSTERNQRFSLAAAALDADGNYVNGAGCYYYVTNDNPEEWTSLGTTEFADVFLGEFFGFKNNPVLECEIQENNATPGFYRLVNPYATHPYADDNYHEISDHNHYIYIHAEDPAKVTIEDSPIGMWLSGSGDFVVNSFANQKIAIDYPEDAEGHYGVLTDNKVLFNANELFVAATLYENGEWLEVNEDGSFYVNIPAKQTTDPEEPTIVTEPTLTLDWTTPIDETILPAAECRMASSDKVSQTILVSNKANNKIFEISQAGIGEKYNLSSVAPQVPNTSEGAPEGATVNAAQSTAIGCDEAGNIIVNWGWPNANTSTDWLLIPADGGIAAAAELKFNFPNGKRCDNVGRVIGDMMSVDGGMVFVPFNAVKYYGGAIVKNGAVDAADCQESLELPGNCNNLSVIVPQFDTVEAQLEAGETNDDWASHAWVYTHNAPIYFWNDEDSEWASRAREKYAETDSKAFSAYGFDVMTLGDKQYIIQGAASADWGMSFVIYDLEGTVVAHWQAESPAASNGNYGTIQAWVREDGCTADIYAYYAGKAAYKLTFQVPAPAYPETCCVLGALEAGFGADKVAPLAVKEEGIFEGEVSMIGGMFAFCEKAGANAEDWAGIGQAWGAQDDEYEIAFGETARIVVSNAMFSISEESVAMDEYPANVIFTVDFKEMTVSIAQGVSGVEAVSVDNAPVEFFNLQGIRVENPQGGIFIRRQGNTTTKVLVK